LARFARFCAGLPYRSESILAIEQVLAEPYVGAWSLSLLSEEPGRAGTIYATCAKHLRTEAADKTHIFYIGPDETDADAAIQLIANGGQTDWQPIAGDPRSFVIWIAENTFHLYDEGP
jgi:hypothetical protein